MCRSANRWDTIAWDFRGGKIGKTRFFPSWEEALEAAGQSE